MRHFHWKNTGNDASRNCTWNPENAHHRQRFERGARTVTGGISSSAEGLAFATWAARRRKPG